MSNVLHESKNNISYIYLNRVNQNNALNKEMLDQLKEIVEKVEQNDDQVVVLAGKGKAFCAGGDMKMLSEFSSKAYYEEVMQTIEEIILKLYLMPKIIISAIHGSAAGLGLSLALTADYVIAEKEAKLGVLFIGIGLAPDGGGHFFLSERLGVHQAKQFTWNMKQVKGPEAKEMGLVDIVTDNPAIEEAIKQGQYIRTTPIQAMIQTKMIYHHKHKEELQSYLKAERKAQWELRNTADHQEGVQAFLEKRKPVFKGR